MRVTAIVENTSRKDLPFEHGLSLFIELANGHRVLFDMGQGRLFADNAVRLGLDVRDVDVAIVSHGHYDHGGGLGYFLHSNLHAKVYVHEDAFSPHYSLRDTGMTYIGLDQSLADDARIVRCANQMSVGEDLTLFAGVHGDCCAPVGNRLLYGSDRLTNDDFCHEQNLLVQEGDKLVLFAGCAHRGIVNILRRATEIAGSAPTHVFAGMHLVKSGLSESEEIVFIQTLSHHLKDCGRTIFYTMHCTGIDQYKKLRALMGPQIEYVSCGDSVTIE